MLNQDSIDKVYLAIGVTDLRKSIDGLSILVKESFNMDPFSKSLFVFCNRKRDKIKILEWNINGFWLYYKRLEKETFKWPGDSNSKTILITDREFRWLLDGLSIHQKKAHKIVKQRIII